MDFHKVLNASSSCGLLGKKPSINFISVTAISALLPFFPLEALSKELQLEEIMVTAQRKEQSLTDVPVSVVAFNADTLVKQGVDSEMDLAFLVPGLLVKSGQNSNQLSFSIRGQTLDPFSGTSPAVLAYINEAPTNGGQSASAFFDFESVQVLKGPQGTLFGRNATGGAVLYSTTRPGEEFGGYLRVRGGERNTLQTQAAVDLPLIEDKLLMRIAADKSEADGWVKNINTGNTLGDVDSESIRLTLVARPSDKLENTFMYQYTEQGGTEGNGSTYSYYPVGELNPKTGNPLVATYDLLYGPGGALAGAGLGDGPVGPGSWPGATAGYLEWQLDNPDKIWLEYDLPHKARDKFLVNTTTYEISDEQSIKNIFSWQDSYTRTPGILSGSPFGSLNLFNVNNAFGCEGSMIDCSGYPGGQRFLTSFWSNEIQIQGSTLDDKLEYIGGLFYSDKKQSDYIPVIVGSELTNVGAPAVADIAYAYKNENTSRAVFGQLTYHINEDWDVTMGGRYTWEKVKQSHSPGSLYYGVIDKQSANLKDPSWTFNVQYKINDQSNVYFSQRGSFRSGAFNGATTTANDANFFKSETTYDFEIGYKFSGVIGETPVRFNAAAYHQTVKDAQQAIYAIVGGGPSAFTVNVPEKVVKGVELDGEIGVTDTVTVGFSTAYTDAEYTENFVDLSAVGAAENLTLDTYQDSPDFTVTLYLDVTIPVPEEIGNVNFRADYFKQSEFYFSSTGKSFTPRTLLDGYSVVNLRVNWENMFGSNYSSAAYVRNLTDEEYYSGGYVIGGSGGVNTAIAGESRGYFAEVSYKF